MGEIIKPRTAKGTRDFSPADMKLRNYILSSIRETFDLYGFEQIETPAVENLETLTGKYGEEGDKLIFKILNSGDYLKDANPSDLERKDSEKLTAQLCEKALRYDLTVPFARYVVQHRNDIVFPFRRYQVQPVWRADRPQKGRYREFYQCDADVIGTNSLLVESELINLIGDVFEKLRIKTTIRLNSRKLLYGFCEANKITKDFVAFTTILDKADKKEWSEVEQDFLAASFSADVVKRTNELRSFSGREFNAKTLSDLELIGGNSEAWRKGLDDLRELCAYLASGNRPEGSVVKIDPTLARGLNYYTGAIIEVVAEDFSIGSICGGGRYDDLTGIFGMPDVSGMGISFGIDRIFDILREKGENEVNRGRSVLLVNFGKEVLSYNLEMLSKLRKAGISAELYPEEEKMKKQFRYADQKKMDFVLVAGPEEFQKGQFSLKDLRSGEQLDLSSAEVIKHISKAI